jgi:hypothetical protein
MAHFAQIDSNNTVIQVIVVEQDVINTGLFGDPATWIQTSYNTRGGVHYGADGEPDGGTALRKNYAGIGYSYDSVRDAFIPPKPYPSWLLDEDTCWWTAPVAQPEPQEGVVYSWNEDTQSWDSAAIPV